MGIDNRLTAEQIAPAAPGDAVVIESRHGFHRPRYATGAVIRVGTMHVDVFWDGRKGSHVSSAIDFVTGSARARAELDRADAVHLAARGIVGRETRYIEAPYRQWHRRPGNLEALRTLRDALSEHRTKRWSLTAAPGRSLPPACP